MKKKTVMILQNGTLEEQRSRALIEEDYEGVIECDRCSELLARGEMFCYPFEDGYTLLMEGPRVAIKEMKVTTEAGTTILVRAKNTSNAPESNTNQDGR